MRLPAMFGALGERDFRLFFTGHAVSVLGDGMAPLALAFAVLDIGSASDLGFVFAARMIPLVGFLLIGGVFADRLSRRVVMLSADESRFVTQGLTAGILISGHAQVWHLIVLQALNGAATAFFNPAVTGLTPLIVSAARLQEGNALRGMAMSGGEIVGPPVAAALVTTVGPGWAIAADAATFGVSALFLAALRLPPHVRLPPQSFVRDLLDGWQVFWSQGWLPMAVLAAGTANMMFASFAVLGPGIAKRSLGGPGAWGLILAAFSAGALAGSLIALRVRPRRPIRAAFIAFLPWVIPLVLLAYEAPALVIAGCALVSGAGALVGNALWETTLQTHVPPAALSRVTAYDWFGSLAFQPLGFALVGPVSTQIGVRETLLLSAGAILAVALGGLALPSVRAVEAKPAFRPE